MFIKKGIVQEENAKAVKASQSYQSNRTKVYDPGA